MWGPLDQQVRPSPFLCCGPESHSPCVRSQGVEESTNHQADSEDGVRVCVCVCVCVCVYTRAHTPTGAGDWSQGSQSQPLPESLWVLELWLWFFSWCFTFSGPLLLHVLHLGMKCWRMDDARPTALLSGDLPPGRKEELKSKSHSG